MTMYHVLTAVSLLSVLFYSLSGGGAWPCIFIIRSHPAGLTLSFLRTSVAFRQYARPMMRD